jgi:hypothetical protein
MVCFPNYTHLFSVSKLISFTSAASVQGKPLRVWVRFVSNVNGFVFHCEYDCALIVEDSLI